MSHTAPPESPPAQLLKTLVEHFPGGVAVMDGQLRLQLWNDRFKTLLDFPDHLFTSPNPHLVDLWRFNLARGEFGATDDPEALLAQLVARAMRFERHVFTRTRPDGTVLEIRGEPIAEGGFVTTWVDITERQHLRAALRRHDELVPQLIQHLPQGVSLFDEQLRLQLWNEAFAEMLEFPPEAVHKQATFESLLGVMARRGDYGPGDPVGQVAQRLALARQFEAHSFERTRPNGRTHLVEGRPVLVEGQVAGFVSTYTDITERKQAELALRDSHDALSQRMEERSIELSQVQSHLSQAMDQLLQSEKLVALGNLVAGVAHELSTPLGNGVMAASSFGNRIAAVEAELQTTGLRRSTLTDFLQFTREASAIVVANLERAAELMLAFKEVAVDQASMRKRDFGLAECVLSVCATMRHLLREQDHRLEVQIEPGLRLHSLPGALEQILANLIANSLVHGFEGRRQGLIRIHAALDDTREHVLLEYRDDGLGMPPETARRAFEPFYTTKMASGGSGLGLHIAYNLASAQLGGTIELQTAPGEGVCFRLRFPRVIV